ncbi:MAG: hypothetical protein H6Q14_2346 [Bacteroidetes bacterium]|jgi:hypothetical protein|nr:hypothetical protein [Bacteroidota bacterium]
MKKKMVFSLAFGLGLMFLEAAVAQTVKVDGELRTRSEYRSGFQSPLADSVPGTLVTSARTRLNLFYSKGAVSAKMTLQDNRVYGSTGVNATGNSLGIYEAWGAYTFYPDLSITVGRQSLEYDDKRMFSASNWSNTGQSHDLALLKYEKKDLKAHLGLAYNNTADDLSQKAYTVSRSYKYMTFAWLAKTLDKVKASALWVNDGFQRGTTNDLLDKLIIRNTVGVNFDYKDKGIPVSAYGTMYYQFGHNTSNKSLSAYLLALKAKVELAKPFVLALGSDYYSGSKYDIDSQKSKTFNKLYGVSHSFNGSIEYWTSLPTRGLVDVYGGLTYIPSKKFNIDATFHSFSLAQEYSADNKRKGLGSEVDITANYLVSPDFSLQGGWSKYFTTDLTKTIKGVSGTVKTDWAYIMLTFKPKFL